jgi:surface protein
MCLITFAQPRLFSIDDDAGSFSSLKSVKVVDQFDIAIKNVRSFALNPMVWNHNNVAVGDTLQLSLFPGKEYFSVIQSKTTDVNGTTVLVSKLSGFQFAWCFISISDQSFLVTIDIPELKEKYSTRLLPQNRTQHLVQLDENKLDVLVDGQISAKRIDSLRQSFLPNSAVKSTQMRTRNINLQNNDGLKSAQLAPVEGDSAQIDVLVVYTPAAKEWADTNEGSINNTISLAIANCNLVSENSKLGIKFNMVHSTEIDYIETGNTNIDLNELAFGNIPNLGVIRDIVAADIVVLLTNNNDVGGLSLQLNDKQGNEEWGYLISRVQQTSGYTMLHEIGHCLGAGHHKDQFSEAGPTIWNNWPENNWSAGWRWKGDNNNYYCDVMTYPEGYYFSDRITHTQVPYFSDPNISFQGQPTGDPVDGNNARTIREMKHVVANYREAQPQITPTVYTDVVHNITKNGATSGGCVTNEGVSKVKARGIVWSSNRMPTLNDHFTVDGLDAGAFTSLINGLDIDSTYYVRAYATNEAGTAYGNQVSFIYSVGIKRDFITRWQLPEGQDELHLILDRIGEVNYTWETVPASQSGSGTFALGDKMVKITNLPAGKVIRVRIATDNLTGFYTSYLICPYPLLINPDRENLIDLEQWGTVQWKNMENAFFECSKLDISATDIPDLSKVTNMSRMFVGCKSLSRIDKINKWSVSTVKNMSAMFNQAEKFNQYIGDWDVSSVTNMSSMFSVAYSFNQDISKWDVSKVTDMGNMFLCAENFNQDIGRWVVSNVLNMDCMFAEAKKFNQNICDWDVSHVKDFSLMFQYATNFNQNIGRWNVSSSTNLRQMFLWAINFNQDIGNWNLANVTHMENMLDYTGMDCFNYSATITGWSTNANTPDDLKLGASDRTYRASAVNARKQLISTKGWTINGDRSSKLVHAGSISGSKIVCQRQNDVRYTVPEIENATSYVWTLLTGAAGNSSSNTIFVNYGTTAVSGNISVKGINLCGESDESVLLVTVNPLPVKGSAISGETTVCQRQNTVIYTVPDIENATSYVWTLPTGATGTSSSNTISLDFGINAVSGIISVQGKNSCGVGGKSVLPVTVSPVPAKPVITRNGDILHSSATSGNQWYNQNGKIDGATNQDYNPVNYDNYYVVVTLSACSSSPSNNYIYIPTGIENAMLNKIIKVYPNPVINELTIEIEGNLKRYNIQIINAMGQPVFDGHVVDKITIQTGSFSTGVYQIRFENNSTIAFKKLIKI